MLLSFSIPKMLPMILNGITDLNWKICHEDNSMSKNVWYEYHWQPHYDVEETDRIKRQTIRELRGPTSPYMRLKVGYALHLWWKSRTPQRELLAIMPCKDKLFLDIHPDSIQLQGRWLKDKEIDDLSFKDGFDSTDDFFQFFNTKKDDHFLGILIKW